jgi:Uma2 family endonuclease
MHAAADEPAIRARMHPIDIATYHAFGAMSHLSERTELIRGVIIDQMPKSPLHTTIVELLGDHLVTKVPADWTIRREQPLTLTDSEPEPDVAVVRGARADYFAEHPRTAALVIEVCVTSEELDRVKLGVYAEAGVPEAWLVLAEQRTVERHTEPQDGAYRTVERAAFPATVPSTVFPALTLPPEGLFPR